MTYLNAHQQPSMVLFDSRRAVYKMCRLGLLYM